METPFETAAQSANSPAPLRRMQLLVSRWEEAGDERCVFLKCYSLMTGNMLAGIDRRRFSDGGWVQNFVERFAGYYFDALDAYDCDAATAPPVWRLAHDAAGSADTWAIQKLLLGINAHINYDLVLTLEELLAPSWPDLPAGQRAARRRDYDTVNRIIGQTIDAVQDDVLEPAMPFMSWIDRVLGPADEMLLSRLLTNWRDHVWQQAVDLMAAREPAARAARIKAVEELALRRAQAIAERDWLALDRLL